MKVNITEKELRNIVECAIKRAVEEDIDEGKDLRYVKANRKGQREADREMKGDGFKSNTKVHKTQKDYSRKGKNRPQWDDELDEAIDEVMEINPFTGQEYDPAERERERIANSMTPEEWAEVERRDAEYDEWQKRDPYNNPYSDGTAYDYPNNPDTEYLPTQFHEMIGKLVDKVINESKK